MWCFERGRLEGKGEEGGGGTAAHLRLRKLCAELGGLGTGSVSGGGGGAEGGGVGGGLALVRRVGSFKGSNLRHELIGKTNLCGELSGNVTEDAVALHRACREDGELGGGQPQRQAEAKMLCSNGPDECAA